MSIIYTALQEKIFSFIEKETGSTVINAVAGSGKTSTIVASIGYIPELGTKKILLLAFNKHIQQELLKRQAEGQIPGSVHIYTLHALGRQLICQQLHIDKKYLEVDKNGYNLKKYIKSFAFQEEWFPSISPYTIDKKELEEIDDYLNLIVQLISFAKLTFSLDVDTLTATARKLDLYQAGILEIERALQILSNWYLKGVFPPVNTISFDDMIFLPAIQLAQVIKNYNQYDVIYVDESQDLNKAQHKFVHRLKKEGGRIIAIGDPRQSIYLFTGADAESFQNFLQTENATELALSECFRCPTLVIRFVNATCNLVITSHPTCQEGEVRYGSYLEAQTGDFILCRTTDQLVSLCLEYIRLGQIATVKGVDFKKALLNLIKNVGASSIEDLPIKLGKEVSSLRETLIDKYENEETVELNHTYINLCEKVRTLIVISTNCTTLYEVEKKIDEIFSDTVSGITLSTIHKAKGLEVDRVFILFDSLIPSVYARTEQELLQESNLAYVSYTRCKQSLIFINDYTTSLQITNDKEIDTHSKRLDTYLESIKPQPPN